MNHSLESHFCISRSLAKKHPQLSHSDMQIIKRLKSQGKDGVPYEDWDTLFLDFLEEISSIPSASLGIGNK